MYSLITFKHVIVLALLFTATHSFADRFIARDIRLEGLQRVSASPVFAVMPVRAGDEITNQVVRDIMQAMLKTGFFTNVQVARDDDLLIVILDERPSIKSLEIDGNKLLKSEQLLEVMSDNGLKEGEIFQAHKLQGISRSIENQYISQARYDAKVDVEILELSNNQIDIKIQIDEGSSAAIRQINIVGNEAFDDDELLDLFELGESRWYRPFSKADKYGKERLTGDIETLESFYLDRGYLDFEVLSSQVSISPNKESVYITLNVHEGNIYTVSEVELAGDPILAEETVKRLILLQNGDVFSQASMTRTNEYITTLLGNSGYTNAEVEGITDKDKENKTVKVTVFVDPGMRNYVRRVNFSGNTKTSDEVLRREMRQLESAPASNSLIERSKVRLDRLGFFKEVNVDTVPVPGSSDLVDVNFTVEEQPSGSISASLGYADFSGLNLGFSVSESNWLGSGNEVSIGVNKNRFQESYNFSYNDPYYTPEGVTRGISVFHRLTDFDEVNFSGSYATDTTGFNVTFGYPISEVSFLRFGAGYQFQSITTGFTAPQQILFSPFLRDNSSLVYITQSDYEDLLSFGGSAPTVDGIPQEFQFDTFLIEEDQLITDELGFIDEFGSDFQSITLSAAWSRRTLNRGILATRGNSQALTLEATAPGSELEYFKLSYEGQLFQPITKSLTLRFSTNLGYGDGYGGLDELPFFENFRAGGFGSVRGFERFTLGPKIVPPSLYTTTHTGFEDVNNNGAVDFGELTSSNAAYVLCEDPTSTSAFGCEPGKLIAERGTINRSRSSSFGGNVLVQFNTELILPIPFVEDSRTMQLVAFVDAGNVFSTNCRDDQFSCSDVDLSKLSSSYGFGFKWLSSFGPLTFSIARPINKDELDQTKFFDFSFGAGF